jgi:lipopolysaccharide transport system permease protein
VSPAAAPGGVPQPQPSWAPLVIEPRRGRALAGILDLGELWRYRELLFFLTWRDVQLRYRQTVLGAAWALLQPLATMFVFAVFLGRLAGLNQKTGGVPYPLQVYSALVLWTFFSASVAASAASVVNNTSLVTKVYFPRLIIPLSSVLSGLVDLFFSLLALLGIFWLSGYGPSWRMLLAPLFVVGAALAAMGTGAFLSALTVAYRDFRYVVPFGLQIWMFVTPIIYPAVLVPPEWRGLLALNPMGGLIEGFQAALLAAAFPWRTISISFASSLLLLLAGSLYFRSVERSFADII